MTRKLRQLLMLATSIYVFTACNSETSSSETKDTSSTENVAVNADAEKSDAGMMMPMTAMMDKMKAMKMTEDFDHDFAALMIDHHQGAVDISEMYLQKATDAEMKTMAQTMVSDHKSEIEELKKFSAIHDPSSAEHKNTKANHTHEGGNHTELAESLDGMSGKMKSMNMTGNADKDYAMLMQSHHENAIIMSKAEISHGHHAALKKMAKKMIDDDTREINEFQKWLSKMK